VTNVEPQKNGRRIDSLVRVIAFVIGMGIAAGVVASSMIPAGAGALGADVHIVAAPTGELSVKPSGLVLEGTGLTPGSEPATGSVQVLNQTGSTLDVRLRGIPDTPDLDRVLRISVTGPDGERIYRGPLGGFRDWSRVAVTFPSGAWRTFRFEAWVPAEAGPGYAGRIAQVDLGFDIRTVTSP
jgi:hypothetical protein